MHYAHYMFAVVSHVIIGFALCFALQNKNETTHFSHSQRRRLKECLVECGTQCGTLPPTPEDTVQTFYYPWYASSSYDGFWRHWKTTTFGDPDNDIITSPFFPRLGAYSTREMLDQHMEWIRSAGIGVVITSWWGIESFEDNLVWDILRSAHKYGRKVAFYIEPYDGGYIRTPTRTAETARDDVKYIIETYGCHQSVYRIDNRPVFLFFAAREHYIGDQSVWKTVWDELHNDQMYNPIVIAHDYKLEERILLGSWDGGHEYGTRKSLELVPQWSSLAEQYDAAGKIFYFTVSPGFHRHRGSSVGEVNEFDRQDGALYDSMWTDAIAAIPKCARCNVVITSFNEWHEGSMIEPAIPFKSLDNYVYSDYEGAFGGLSGDAASFSYLTRTKFHSDQLLYPPTSAPSRQPQSPAPQSLAPQSPAPQAPAPPPPLGISSISTFTRQGMTWFTGFFQAIFCFLLQWLLKPSFC